ncbi:MAG: ABC transporter permease, partial [Alphaproteobacteria bacterium]
MARGTINAQPTASRLAWWAAWGIVFGAGVALWAAGKSWAPWAFKVPRDQQLPINSVISEAMRWLIEDATFGIFTFRELTRAISAAVEVPYKLVLSIISTGLLEGQGSDAVQLLPPVSWIAVIAIIAAAGLFAKDWKLAAVVGGAFTYLAVFGQWESAMVTLSSILVAAPLGIAGGLLIGILAYRA